MKKKHYRGQKHFSGKELLEQRKSEKEKYKKKLEELENDEKPLRPITYFPSSSFAETKYIRS